MSDTQVLIQQDHGVVTVTLNRPDKLNALTDEMKKALVEAIRQVAHDDDAKVLVLTGAGRGFCVGADLSATTGSPMLTQKEGPRAEWYKGRWSWITELRGLEKPVLAAVNGVCAGAGISLALVCDVRFASDRASFLPAFLRRAILPDGGASHLLTHLIGPSRALHLLWRGEAIDASEAWRQGLVEEVVPHEELMQRTMTFARDLATGPSVPIELTKRLVYRALAEPDLASHAEYEQFLWTFSKATEDYEEGRRSFQERRAPLYTGR